MKRLFIIHVLSILVSFAKGQELKIIKTDSLYHIANEFGLDSALSISQGLPIYKIDSLTALKLLDFVTEYSFPSKSGSFFSSMAHNWKIKPVQDKTNELAVNKIKNILSDTTTVFSYLERRSLFIGDQLLVAIIIQKPDSIESYLIDCYKYLFDLAEQYKKLLPSAHIRFFQYFKDGNYRTAMYRGCHIRCYEVMWTLGQLGSSFFDKKKLSYHNRKFARYEKPNALRYYSPYREFGGIKEISLNNDYNSIEDIDFLNEPELVKILQNYNIERCWSFILSNDKLGFLDVGCSFAPLAGYGYTYKIELYEPNKIRFTAISGWIS